MQEILDQLLSGRSLSEHDADLALTLVLTGQANEAQVGAFLALLARKGVVLDELTGAARVMRRYVTPVPAPAGISDSIIDTCGTGGAPKTFNISTLAAIVVAGAERGGKRVCVAKHGGRSRSGRGSAEVLSMLGVNVDATPDVQARCLEEAGVCFSFAINHHPAMKFAAGPRKSLGFPTVFNLLGPLTNPAGAKRQLLGVYDERAVEMVAAALQRLGTQHAMVVHGSDGMDEITTAGTTTIVQVRPEGISTLQVAPEQFGLARASHEELRADSLGAAAELFRQILGGKSGPPRDIVVLNAGAALVVGEVAKDFGEGIELAKESIDSGRAKRALDLLISRSNG